MLSELAGSKASAPGTWEACDSLVTMARACRLEDELAHCRRRALQQTTQAERRHGDLSGQRVPWWSDAVVQHRTKGSLWLRPSKPPCSVSSVCLPHSPDLSLGSKLVSDFLNTAWNVA